MSFKLYHCAGKGCLLMLAPEMRQRVQSVSLNATSTFATPRPTGTTTAVAASPPPHASSGGHASAGTTWRISEMLDNIRNSRRDPRRFELLCVQLIPVKPECKPPVLNQLVHTVRPHP